MLSNDAAPAGAGAAQVDNPLGLSLKALLIFVGVGVLAIVAFIAVTLLYFDNRNPFASPWAKARCSVGAACGVWRSEANCQTSPDPAKPRYHPGEFWVWARGEGEAREAMAAHRPNCRLTKVAYFGKYSPNQRGKQRLGQFIGDLFNK